MIGGYQRRIDDQREVLAPLVAAMVNVHIKSRMKKLKPEDLLPPHVVERRKKQEKDERDPEEIKAERRELMAEVKRKGAPNLRLVKGG